MKDIKEYYEFLERKKHHIEDSGFSVEDSQLNPILFPFQKYCVKKALNKGKYALFEDCGLGKTIQQLEWASHIVKHTSQPVLIIAPLAVVGQTINEGQKFGYNVIELGGGRPSENSIYITNYDNIKNVVSGDYSGVVLDESSILKNFDGETKKQIIELFSDTPYKLACTATPSPNDVMELCNHAEFLNVMSRNEMLAMYFIHDGGNTTSWRLKGHCEQMFWDFVSDWAVMLCKPSDIGFSDEGYVLPAMNLIETHIETDKRDNGKLFNDTSVNATDYNKELRATINERLQKVAEIVNNSEENWIVWIKQDDEGDMLRKLIPDAVEVRGSENPQSKRDKLIGFGQNKYRVLITKLKIAQFGLNYQNCHNQIYASLDFSFESTYQGIRRSWRFGQEHEVNVYLICTDTMANVRETIVKKQTQFENMQRSMTAATNRNIGIKKTQKVITGRTAMILPKFI